MERISSLTDKEFPALYEIRQKAISMVKEAYPKLHGDELKPHIDYINKSLLEGEYESALNIIRSQERYLQNLKKIHKEERESLKVLRQ